MKKTYAWLVQKSPEIRFYTYLSNVFKGVPDLIEKYDWLFSDYECNFYPSPLKINEDTFVTGSELRKMISEDEPQIFWGIISSVAVGTRFDIAKNPIWSDGNPDFWKPDVYIQNPESEIEITCWDSGLFIFMTTLNETSKKFVKSFPEALDLVKYNGENQSRRNQTSPSS